MYDAKTRSDALTRIAAGQSLRSISLATGINRTTLREWRETNGAYRTWHRSCRCPGCDDTLSEVTEDYVYILGQYLGDGHVAKTARSAVLRIACCDGYPRIMDTVDAAMRSVVGGSVFRVRSVGCTVVQSNTKQWLHLLPQHGPGMKHTRPIVLQPWQRELVAADPRPLIRGLIHSDGCRITNWTEKTVGGTTKRVARSAICARPKPPARAWFRPYSASA